MSISRGVYFIQNAGLARVFDLKGGLDTEGNAVINFTKHPTQWSTSTDLVASNQLWLVEPIANTVDTFTIRNLKTGGFVDLLDGKADRGVPIQCRKGTGKDCQKWIIKRDNYGKYRLQNVASKTYVDIGGGAPVGAQIMGWLGDITSTNDHQQWLFERVSRSAEEIKHVLLRSPLFTQSIQSYQLDGEYIILPQGAWKTIWKDSGLDGRALRSEIFDWDSFAVAYKTALSNWASGQIGADLSSFKNVTILAGIVFGRKAGDGAGISYNFSLTDDFGKVLFYNPQKNTFQDNIDYYPVFGFF
ncbi:hypothetical protein VNI00_007291 [Paramarasmius palmivorus]|uniref:Carbohydrate-binding module family 13 protein n=1 Tax=Paramarasmius palmivorus TaxID=297713 RepID=A0AAW0D0S6_9AGAR